VLQAQSGLGLLALLALAWALSEDRRRVDWRFVAIAMAIEIGLAALFLHVPALTTAFQALNAAVGALQRASEAGSGFVFGYLGGGPLPFEESQPGASFVLAFRALPLIIVISALTALLNHWRILPAVVRGLAVLLQRSLGVGGAVALSTAANIFVGMVEAPLFIRPYLLRLSRSELFVVMVGGMASIAGTVLVLYAVILSPLVPGVAGHLMLASILSAPAAILVARLMVPERGGGSDADRLTIEPEANSAMDALTKGTESGLKLYLNVLAMLLVLVALVHLANAALGLLPDLSGAPLTLQRLLGWAMTPFALALGLPWAEAQVAGALLGVKTVLNELVAYLDLARTEPALLAPRSRLILTYALCGFANFGSLGILIGGLAAMAPERRSEIVQLGGKSIVAGTLATCLLGATVGLLTP